MKSLSNLADQPVSIPLLADDVLEFHAARLLLLLRLCGVSGRIDELTKMAKLDFFVRYPQFFAIACEKLGVVAAVPTRRVESSMIRFRYGPWDNRYYHLLSYLEAKHLVVVRPKGNRYELQLTDSGNNIAGNFEKDPAFSELASHMKLVKKVLGSKAGSALKNLIYQLFKQEVAQRPLGEVIE